MTCLQWALLACGMKVAFEKGWLNRIELQQALQAAVLERTSEIERAAADVVRAEVLKLCDIVKIGLGGYVIGRSAEKILPGIVRSAKER